MKTVPLNAYPRTATRRGPVKQLRAHGRVPAIVYGRATEPTQLEIHNKELQDLIQHAASETLLVDLSIADAERPQRLALVKEIQHHPMSRSILHVDLQEISEDQHVTVTVPVETKGEAVGVKTGGGILEHVLFKLKVRALPRDLPEVLELDVTNLNVGESIHIGEIPPVPGVEILGEKVAPVITVAAPLTEEQAADAEAEAGAAPVEVEMTKEKKEGETASEGKAGAKGGEKAPEKKPPEKK